jgi:DNA ligase-1
MRLPTLYKRSTTGAVLEWCIEVENNKHRTLSGQQNGAVTVTEWTICKGKNTGKANSTTDNEQALKDAQSKWKKKIEREQFVEDIKNIDIQAYIAPMLAQKFTDRKDEIDFNNGVWIQCKLNGARCVATKDGLFSRKGSVWQSVPHINNALKGFFEKHPNAVLDGELFNEDLRQDLGSIISMLAKKKLTQEILDKSKQYISYYVYDIVDQNCSYKERLKTIDTYIKEINSNYIKSVETIPVMSIKDIDNFLVKFEEQGHEGVIVRTNGVYECKRSKHLLKHKSFIDDEFEIIDVLEGEGNLSGMVGKFLLKNDKGIEFKSSPTGSHEYWKQLWLEKDNLKGKFATVKFKELTPEKNGQGGVPSFGKVVAIRNYE